MLTEEQREFLLSLARDAIKAAVAGTSPPELDCGDEQLCEKSGAFVTIKRAGRLRGCIGQFTSDGPLWQTVRNMARAAAVEDSRFFHNPIQPGEVDDLSIEVSVLSPLKRVTDPLDFELGVHGIYIKRGFQRGCFLPQVATETGWSKEEFLTQCAAGKAGMPPDAWKQPDTEVYVFTAEIIGQSE